MKISLFKITLALLLCSNLQIFAQEQVQALFDDNKEVKSMAARWELDSISNKGTFLLTPYKSVYVLPFLWSSDPVRQPISGNPDPGYVNPEPIDYNAIEAVFQLSFKTKILHDFLWSHADLWVAYTQVSYWQIYNEPLSRPFRELNYEPEIILNFPVNFKILGLNTKMLGVSFNHESNGKSLPFSRSWNRVIFMAGLTKDNWHIYIRPWYVIPESKGDNPDISSYIGNGDLNVIYTKDQNVFTFTGTNNFNFEGNMRGNAMVSWAFPIKGNLKGYLQVSHGFGTSLIGYNQEETTIGLGVSLIEFQ